MRFLYVRLMSGVWKVCDIRFPHQLIQRTKIPRPRVRRVAIDFSNVRYPTLQVCSAGFRRYPRRQPL